MITKPSPLLVDVVHTTVNRGIKEDLYDKLIYPWLMRLCKKSYLSAIFNVCSGKATTHLSRKSLLSSTMVLMKHISLLSHGQKLPIRFGQPHLKLNHYGLKVHRLFKTTESRYRCKAMYRSAMLF